MSQLVIQNEAYEQGEEEAFPSDPSSTAKEVKASVQHLITAAVRLMHESSDEVIQLRTYQLYSRMDICLIGMSF